MSRKIPANNNHPLPSLPGQYDRLLLEYVDRLENVYPNPYEMSIRKRILEWIDIRGQIKYARSSYISDFVRSPNTLKQDLPCAAEMLERLSEFDEAGLRTLVEMNTMNLSRLRRRSISEAIAPGIALIGSILGLLPVLHSLFPISIEDPILPAIPQITIALLLKAVIVISLLLGIGNRMVTVPRIGLVDALGGILKIAVRFRKSAE